MIAIIEIKNKLFQEAKKDCQNLREAPGERGIDSCLHEKNNSGQMCVNFDCCPRLSTEQVFFIDGVEVDYHG